MAVKPFETSLPALYKKDVDAITLWPFIFYRKGKEDDIPLRCHEYFHWRQALRWGVLPWYAAYVLLLPFNIGKEAEDHPLEKPAYRLQRKVQAKLDAGENIEAELTHVGLEPANG